MILVRDDDVLVGSSSIKDTFARFKGVHELICKAPQLKHVPTILVEEIQAFPQCIEYLQYETSQGRMRPELHGYRHVDYGALDKQEVRNQLVMAYDWFCYTFNYRPTKWYTPWGAAQQHIQDEAKGLKLELVGQSMKTNGRYGIIQSLRDGHSLDKFKEVGIHWWKARDTYNLELLINYINTGELDGNVQSVLK